MRRVVWAIALLVLLASGGIVYRQYFLEGGSRPPAVQAARPAPPVPVLVAEAVRQPLPVRLDAIGTAQPYASLSVKSRLDAQIAEVKVKDGQYVKMGDTLFLLDRRAAEAQTRQMDAQLARDRAQLANARRDVERFAPLVAKDFVSRQQYDTATTNAQALEAGVKADEAALDNAKVLLSYYTITSPIDGRIGMVAAKTGNNVKANDVPFLTVNQVKPIYVLYSVSERALPAIRAAMAAGPVTVRAAPAGDNGPPVEGKLAFFENAVDVATGTIALRATFENQDERLWPGQFVNVAMALSVESEALVVPQAAVQIGQNSSFVFVVKSDNTAEARNVAVSRTVDGKSVIESGLQPGERVVIDGQLRLSNGSRVNIRSAQGQPAPGNPS